MRRLWLSTCLLCANGAAQDYFPLHLGNQWVYRVSGTARGGVQDPLVLSIAGEREIEGRRYALLTGSPRGEFWLRSDAEGNLWSWDTGKKADTVWYAFGRAEGEIFQTTVPYCCGQARIRTRKAIYEGPAGTWENALELDFPGVFQVGLEREVFLPWLGMVERVEAAGGPAVARYELIYARIGGVTVLSEPETSFRLTLDRAEVREGPLRARLTLRHTGAGEAVLTFPGQQVDLSVRDAAGRQVYLWSADKSFPAMVETLRIAGGEKHWFLEAPAQFPPGEYTVEAWLTTMGGVRYRAGVGFSARR